MIFILLLSLTYRSLDIIGNPGSFLSDAVYCKYSTWNSMCLFCTICYVHLVTLELCAYFFRTDLPELRSVTAKSRELRDFFMRVKVLLLQYLLRLKYLKFCNSEEVDKVSTSLTVFTFTQGLHSEKTFQNMDSFSLKHMARHKAVRCPRW